MDEPYSPQPPQDPANDIDASISPVEISDVETEIAEEADPAPGDLPESIRKRFAPLDSTPEADEASQPFVTRWNGLISQTNWEKGRIIFQWRQAKITEGADSSTYADQIWADLVGGVTSQHVGRLRRVYERFGASQDQFENLFWSHFYAAMDWDDAEMWLEGAVQNGWSVSQMRRTRWEALGAVADLKPSDAEIITSEPEEDTPPLVEPGDDSDSSQPTTEWDAQGEVTAEPEASSEASEAEAEADDDLSGTAVEAAPQRVAPFENLAALPDDMADAFESMKLAVVRQRIEGWVEISRDDVLGALEGLRQLILAPPDED